MKYGVKATQSGLMINNEKEWSAHNQNASVISGYGYTIVNIPYEDIQCSDFVGIVFSESKYEQRKKMAIINELRHSREKKCFAIANRNFFFNEATIAEMAEINNWYTAWLNVTDTLVVPIVPHYISSRIGS